jgi:hypothetical protein
MAAGFAVDVPKRVGAARCVRQWATPYHGGRGTRVRTRLVLTYVLLSYAYVLLCCVTHLLLDMYVLEFVHLYIHVLEYLYLLQRTDQVCISD